MTEFTDREISQSHTIDDLGRERYLLRRKRDEARELLSDVNHAIDNGRLEVAKEFVERALVLLADPNRHPMLGTPLYGVGEDGRTWGEPPWGWEQEADRTI